MLDSLMHPQQRHRLAVDRARPRHTSGFDLDGPLPEIPESNASKSGRERVIERARRDNLTVRQLAQIAGSYGGLALVGTPKTIADQMEEWLYSDACDGFNIMFPWVPGGLDDFADRIVPELQRRHLFRREYDGKTLRENLGLRGAIFDPIDLSSPRKRGPRVKRRAVCTGPPLFAGVTNSAQRDRISTNPKQRRRRLNT